MTQYDYRQAVKDSVYDALFENYTKEEILEELENNRERFINKLHDDFFLDDSVTGNASGSFTFNTWQAEEYLSHNWSLLCEVADAFGDEPLISDSWNHGAEWWDVSIRCYLLDSVIDEVLVEIEEESEDE